MVILPLLGACESGNTPEPGGSAVPEGMVEIRPVLPGMHAALPRAASQTQSAPSRTYDTNDETNERLAKNHLLRLPEGSTVWLIAEGTEGTPAEGETAAPKTYVKKPYVVYNPEDNENMSYLVPCTVNKDGDILTMEGSPLYLTNGKSYRFYAISPARELNEEDFKKGKISFQVKNGESFYANDCRYSATTPQTIQVKSDNSEAVQVIELKPMINQTAELKFLIEGGTGIHDLGIQPSGIQISGLQNDSPVPAQEGIGDKNGLFWHMSQSENDEPIVLQHGGKWGTCNRYDYTIDTDKNVNIEVPVLPMFSISKPVIVVFRLKINGVPTSYEMMLNEKDFKAGYSYGYRGVVSISEGVTVITWQYVSWEYDTEFPFPKNPQY